MKKPRKILLLLPFFSIAMPEKNGSGAEKATEQESTQLEIGTMSFDIMTLVSEFSTRSTANKIKYIHSSYFSDINNRVQIEEIYQTRINSSKAHKGLLALANALKLRPAQICFPDYISFFGSLPKEVKASLTNLVKEGKYNRSINFSQFGSQIKIPKTPELSYVDLVPVILSSEENLFDEPNSENYWQNLLRLSCVQKIIKKVNFRKDLSEDEIINRVKGIVSKFEYVTRKMIIKGSAENLRFKRELAKKIQKDTCFIVKADYVYAPDYSLSFRNLSGDNHLAKMHIIMLVETKMDMYKTWFYPASLSVYTLKSFNIYDDTILQDFQFLNWPSSKIGDKFLSQCYKLTSLDLSPFNHVTQIGNEFLHGCSGLKEIDLTQFSRVTQIGDAFLHGDYKLKDIDLTPLNQVTKIGNKFLYACEGLTSLDLNPLHHLTQIKSEFLFGCSGLTNLDLSPLNQVTFIGSFFLFGCSGLTNIDLSPLSQVTKIEGCFLRNCIGLTNLDLNPLKRITFLEHEFLSGCTGLTDLDLSPLNRITKIEKDFLCGCKGLTNINLSMLSNFIYINDLLPHCTGLTNLDLSPLNKVKQIGYCFLIGCTGLTTLDLKPLSQVTKIGGLFLRDCTGLRTLDLSPLAQTTFIGDYFLYECTGLTTLDLSGFNKVTEVGSAFLQGCISLKRENINLGTLSADHPVVKAVAKAIFIEN